MKAWMTNAQIAASPVPLLIDPADRRPTGAYVRWAGLPAAQVIPPHPLLSPPQAGGAGLASPATVAARLATCRACPHLRPGGAACGVLAGRCRDGVLMHRLGVPRAASRCPDDPPRWGPEA